MKQPRREERQAQKAGQIVRSILIEHFLAFSPSWRFKESNLEGNAYTVRDCTGGDFDALHRPTPPPMGDVFQFSPFVNVEK